MIVDEVHAVAGTKRGAHLALSLERLDALLPPSPAQRIGLSATVRPLDEVAKFLGGTREVTIVNPPSDKDRSTCPWSCPVEDMGEMGEALEELKEGPAAGAGRSTRRSGRRIEARLVEMIQAHRSTIVFVNSRRLSERLCARINELAEEEIARPTTGRSARSSAS